MKKILKKVTSHTIAFGLGAIVFAMISAYAATTLSSSSVYYDNSNSGGTSTNVAGAIDELYDLSDIRKRPNIIVGYTYNQTSGASNYCVTGDESTCKETKCYESTTAGSCPAGTIIVYKVNENEIVRFHVIYDNGKTLTMQSQRNTIYNTKWIDATDYASENTDATTCAYESCNDEGPITILEALERATVGWDNVNTLTYTMGTTTFKTNAYTGCSSYSSCAANTYTLPSRTSKARMITLQEAKNLGCTETNKSCPIWMYNYLCLSTSYGGTVNDGTSDTSLTANYAYWTMSAKASNAQFVWFIHYYGNEIANAPYLIGRGARAVVEINK